MLLGSGPTAVLDDMPIFVDQSAAAAAGVEGNMLPGEDTASQNVLVDKIFGGKKLVKLKPFYCLYVVFLYFCVWM